MENCLTLGVANITDLVFISGESPAIGIAHQPHVCSPWQIERLEMLTYAKNMRVIHMYGDYTLNHAFKTMNFKWLSFNSMYF